MISLMYITNQPEVAKIAEDAGIDWIFIDMEFIGKSARQVGMNTVQNSHSIKDIEKIKQCLRKAKILVRVNPIHDAMENYFSSKDEIDAAIAAGADILMLPFFHTADEVKQFVAYVGGRAKTCLLLETSDAAERIDEILQLSGIDMIHIGLNDMHLEKRMDFMFELLTDGTVERLGNKIKAKGIKFGFGGIARLNTGMLSGATVLKEHYRLGSEMVIVSRSFCNTDAITDLDEVKSIFEKGINEIRELEIEAQNANIEYFERNRKEAIMCVNKIIEIIKSKK